VIKFLQFSLVTVFEYKISMDKYKRLYNDNQRQYVVTFSVEVSLCSTSFYYVYKYACTYSDE